MKRGLRVGRTRRRVCHEAPRLEMSVAGTVGKGVGVVRVFKETRKGLSRYVAELSILLVLSRKAQHVPLFGRRLL